MSSMMRGVVAPRPRRCGARRAQVLRSASGLARREYSWVRGVRVSATAEEGKEMSAGAEEDSMTPEEIKAVVDAELNMDPESEEFKIGVQALIDLGTEKDTMVDDEGNAGEGEDEDGEDKMSPAARVCYDLCDQYIDDDSKESDSVLDPKFDSMTWLTEEMGVSMYPRNIHPNVFEGELGWHIEDDEVPISGEKVYTQHESALELVAEMERLIDQAKVDIEEEFGEEAIKKIFSTEMRNAERDMEAVQQEIEASMGNQGFSDSSSESEKAQFDDLGEEVWDTLTNEDFDKEDEEGTTQSNPGKGSVPLGAAGEWDEYERKIAEDEYIDTNEKPPSDEIPDDFGDPFVEEEEAVEEESDDNSYGVPPRPPMLLSRLLSEVADHIEIRQDLDKESEEVMITGVSSDSRTVEPGHLFVCLRGASFDGHDFAADAVAAGAVAVLSEYRARGIGDAPQVRVADTDIALQKIAAAFYGYPSRAMDVIGVTGTNGKTSTVNFIHQMLYATMDLDISVEDDLISGGCGMIGTVEYSMFPNPVTKIMLTAEGKVWKPTVEDKTRSKRCTGTRSKPLWFPIWVKDETGQFTGKPGEHMFMRPPVTRWQGKYEAPMTTPDPLQMQKILASMADVGVTDIAMEVSSHALDQGRVDEVDIDVAIFTNLTRDHLDYHGSFEEYREAKGKLFEKLVDPERQVAIINIDDTNSDFFIERADPVPIITYALSNPNADVYLIGDAATNMQGTMLTIRTPLGDIQTTTKILGKPMLSNMLAAVCFALVKQYDLETIQMLVYQLKPPPGRMEFINAIPKQPFFCIVDYAHTPDALSKLLDTVSDFTPNRIITVVGCGGDRDNGKRPLMGRIAHDKSDIVFFTNDNPRNERPELIIRDIVAGLPPEVADAFPFLDFDWLQDPLRLPDAKYGFPACPQLEAALYFQSEIKRFIVEDRFDAIRLAMAMCDEGDTIVIAGKGHEDYQILGDTKGWFDDRVEAADAIQRLLSLKKNFLAVDVERKSKEYGQGYNMLDTSVLPWRITTRPDSPLHDPDKPLHPHDNNYIRQYLQRRGIPEWEFDRYWR